MGMGCLPGRAVDAYGSHLPRQVRIGALAPWRMGEVRQNRLYVRSRGRSARGVSWDLQRFCCLHG